jgi:hypothetical protein
MILRLAADRASDAPTADGSDGADGVADLLEEVAAAGGFLAEELDLIASSRAPVSEYTVLRLEALAARLRPAARMRARLGGLDPQLLVAGVRRWVARRDAAVRRDAG